MKKVADLVVGHSKVVLLLFGLLTFFIAALMPSVTINYNLAEYIPEGASSTIAIDVMASEFEDAVPNVRVFVPDVSVVEAVQIKQQIC